MTSNSSHTWFSEIIIILLVLLFAYTGTSKLLENNIFQIQIFRATFSEWLTPLIAWGLPVAELILAVLLVIDRTRLTALWISFVLLILFTLYIIGMLLFNSNLPCKCGGVIKQMGWKTHILFNLCFIALACQGIRMKRRRKISISGSMHQAGGSR